MRILRKIAPKYFKLDEKTKGGNEIFPFACQETKAFFPHHPHPDIYEPKMAFIWLHLWFEQKLPPGKYIKGVSPI